MSKLMTPAELRAIHADLRLTGKEMSVMLGCSYMGHKSFLTAKRLIPIYIVRLALAAGIVNSGALMANFLKVVKKYLKTQAEDVS